MLYKMANPFGGKGVEKIEWTRNVSRIAHGDCM